MTRMKALVLVLLGVIVGVTTSEFARPVFAQVPATTNDRMTYTKAANSFAEMYFLKGKKSGGCWLWNRSGGGSVAVAPPGACD